MNALNAGQRVQVILGIFTLVIVISLAHIARSTYLKKSIPSSWMKMYTSFVVISIVGALALANVISGDALTALIGTIAGYILGTKESDKEPPNRGQ
jgi:4-amino-4-deoxy-L-arabinose transferase-like glycosyltransferase